MLGPRCYHVSGDSINPGGDPGIRLRQEKPGEGGRDESLTRTITENFDRSPPEGAVGRIHRPAKVVAPPPWRLSAATRRHTLRALRCLQTQWIRDGTRVALPRSLRWPMAVSMPTSEPATPSATGWSTGWYASTSPRSSSASRRGGQSLTAALRRGGVRGVPTPRGALGRRAVPPVFEADSADGSEIPSVGMAGLESPTLERTHDLDVRSRAPRIGIRVTSN